MFVSNRIRKQSQKVTIAVEKNFTKTVALGHCLLVREQGSARSQLIGILVLAARKDTQGITKRKTQLRSMS